MSDLMGGLEVLFCGFETDFNFIIILMKRLLVVPVFRRHIWQYKNERTVVITDGSLASANR